MSFLDFLSKAKTNFHAVNEIKKLLNLNGYQELFENQKWDVKLGDKVYIVRNQSAIIALNLPESLSKLSFNISASHTDSPNFKLKPNHELTVANYMVSNTEPYSVGIFSSWFDRPLSIAGRVLVMENGVLKSKLVDLDDDLLIIPNMPIHFQRDVNNGYSYNPQIDLLPISGLTGKLTLDDLIEKELKVKKEDIVSEELTLYVRDRGHVLGVNNEFIVGPQLDDLACAYGTLMGFIDSKPKAINVFCAFDNEETGSMSKQGAFGTFLSDVFVRLKDNLGYSDEDLRCAFANSFLVSADNAHAVHPNHVSKYDSTNRALINEGVVIKTNSNLKYTSDSVSVAIMKEICSRANVKYQLFANRSDVPGGSTLGNISNVQISMNAVDIGLPQLAMHSAYETMGLEDLDSLVLLMKAFFSTSLEINLEKEIKIFD